MKMKRSNPLYKTLDLDVTSTLLALALVAYFGGYVIWEIIIK